MTLKGKRRSKFFADAGHGGKKKAMAKARAYRDALVATRPPKRLVARPLVVVRGKAPYCQIRIPTASGSKTTEFSIRRHGARKARSLAIEAYNAATAKLRSSKR